MSSLASASNAVATMIDGITASAYGAVKALGAATDAANAYAQATSGMPIGTSGGPSVGASATSLGDPRSADDFAAGMIAALDAATRR